jgi:uncharacterized membrane protein
MSSLILPLILFVGFIGFRIASIMATRKREAQLRAVTVTMAREVRAALTGIMRDTEQLQQRATAHAPAEIAADIARIAAAQQQLSAYVETQLAAAGAGAPST